jgi:hypothetical protein
LERQNVIETVTDNHAILLLYLNGELPESDRLEVEKRLAADARLAGQLAELDAMHQRISNGIAALDEIDANPLSADSAIDAAVDSISNWQFGPRPILKIEASANRRIWAWVAPASLAASILIAAIIWVERRPAVDPGGSQIASTQAAPPKYDDGSASNDSEVNLALLQQSFDAGSEEVPRHSARDNRRQFVAANEDLSDYLLKTEVNPQ